MRIRIGAYFLLSYFFPTSSAEPESAIHFASHGDMNMPFVVSIDGGVAYRIREDGRIVGGLVLNINEETRHNHLDLLFVTPAAHSKGVGTAAWKEVERLYPETEVWETCTPYFETRNVHFYVNKCGFHIVEFFNSRHPDPHDPESGEEERYEDGDGMFRFEKRMTDIENGGRKANG